MPPNSCLPTKKVGIHQQKRPKSNDNWIRPPKGDLAQFTKHMISTLQSDIIDEELSLVMTSRKSPSYAVQNSERTTRSHEENLDDYEMWRIGASLRHFATFENRRSLFNKKRALEIYESPCCQSNKQAKRCSEKKCLKSTIEEKHLTRIVHTMEAALQNGGITGDGRTTLGLPTIVGKHNDLNNISAETLRDLMKGKYADTIASYRIIDCRYPYEFEGGHIQGAENIYTEESILGLLRARHSAATNIKRNILIFHCEFSTERGPTKCRFLRNKDRDLNKENYPVLNFPEIYLLHNGYMDFYTSYKTLCEPPSYKPMLHKDHSKDLKFFRKKSTAWSAGEKKKHARQLLRF
ncbi:M-phase inducer phosphatase-like [Ostrea edulis]|uniref:M-phase inducer phosphatase-like n=1 Tax=Ostrea edulis TaxID=37623 RepID=UPI0024AEA283|nr:M-phase inducer phosphatase-like [Ostrea edulis]